MRVLHLVAADRWTGAAATALQLVEALRDAGVDARLAYRPGHNLEARLAGLGWTQPILAKERSVGDLRRAVAAVRRAARGSDLVHCHLPHDHLLARLALRGPAVPIVRSVRHRRHLRGDPFYGWLLRGTAALALANSDMEPLAARRPALVGVPRVVLPPVAGARFRPGLDGRPARARLGVPADAVVAGMVGKLAAGRGQDVLLHALAAAPATWGLIVGGGDHEKRLRTLARRLGVVDRLAFAGYVEDGLELVYAAMDLFVFPAAGSDHGHRAIAEASACGVPTLAADLPGVRDLVEVGASGALWPADDAAALAVLLAAWTSDAVLRASSGRAAAASAADRTAGRLASTVIGLYRSCTGGSAPGRPAYSEGTTGS
jgi:glycosyltransferase involved in cell wall biosynthesis